MYTDVRWGKIKNFVTFPLVLFGWSWVFVVAGWKAGLLNVFVSCFTGFLACAVGRLGEGDIKLIVGISACMGPGLAFIFLAFFYLTMLAAAVLVRLRLYGFRLKPALSALKTEVLVELSAGAEAAQEAAHGKKVKHLGGPVIFMALVFCLIFAMRGGLLS